LYSTHSYIQYPKVAKSIKFIFYLSWSFIRKQLNWKIIMNLMM